jgi:hypothetical protein
MILLPACGRLALAHSDDEPAWTIVPDFSGPIREHVAAPAG